MSFIGKKVVPIHETFCFTTPGSSSFDKMCLIKTLSISHDAYLLYQRLFSTPRQKATVSSTDDFMKSVDPNDLLWRDLFAIVVHVCLGVCL